MRYLEKLTLFINSNNRELCGGNFEGWSVSEIEPATNNNVSLLCNMTRDYLRSIQNPIHGYRQTARLSSPYNSAFSYGVSAVF